MTFSLIWGYCETESYGQKRRFLLFGGIGGPNCSVKNSKITNQTEVEALNLYDLQSIQPCQLTGARCGRRPYVCPGSPVVASKLAHPSRPGSRRAELGAKIFTGDYFIIKKV